jgi:hypothetical protein
MIRVQPLTVRSQDTAAGGTPRSHSAGKRQFTGSSSNTFHVIEGGTPDPVALFGKRMLIEQPSCKEPISSKRFVRIETRNDPPNTGVKRLLPPEKKPERCIRSSIFLGYTNRTKF